MLATRQQKRKKEKYSKVHRSPGSARCICSRHLQSSFGQLSLMLNLRIRQEFGGLCARQRCSTYPGKHDLRCAGEHDLCCAVLVCTRYTKMSDVLAWHQTPSVRTPMVRLQARRALCQGPCCTSYTKCHSDAAWQVWWTVKLTLVCCRAHS